MSATLRTLALAVLLLMALVSPLASGATPFHLIRNSHIFVSPEGIDGETCGQEKQPCRTLHAAVALAAPYTRIIVSNGTYDCGLHITVPVSISGVENGVYLRCGGTKRGIWFDGVPAQIEGVHIEDGYGEGAGGILVTQHSEHVLYTNYISHCSFRACVGTPSSVVKGVAGAVLISYTKARYPRPYFIEASRFEGNYARGDVAPAGAVAIHLPVANETPNEKCKVFSIDRSESNDPNVGTYAGVYRAVEGLSISGTTVYNSLGRKPTAADGTEEVKWVALCPQNNLYGFFTTVGVPARSFDGCDNDISGMVHMDGVPLFENEWWLAKHTLSRAFLHLRCQDDAMAPKKCDHFYPVNMPGPQSSRQALFTVIPDLVIAQRPTFVSVDVEDPHWVWYCDSLKEWIFTDTDPHSLIDGVPEQCRRGVASGPTHAMHPLMVDTWKFWNNATNQWATAPLRRSGGMHIVCISPDELPCNTVQLVNANNEASVFQGDLHPPTLQFPRAVYTSYHTQPPQYMAFCAKFNEWMITNDDPRLDETTSEVCERALSSSRTTAPTPEEAGRWFVFGQTVSNAWQASTMEAMCVTGCHSITISSVVDQACPACGDYVAGGLHSGFRFYRQVNGLASHVIFRSTDHPWVVTPAVNMRVGATRDDVLLTALIVGDTTDDLMNSRRWHGGSASAGNSVYKHLLVECAAVHNCSSFDVRHSTHTSFNGVFERGSVIMGRRPTYQNRRQTALMYFDDVESRWIVKHRDSPDLRLASRRTRSVTPGSTTVWSLEGKRKKSKSSSATNANADIEEWTYAEVKSRLVVVCEGTEATRSAASSSAPLRSTDMIAHSVFTGNVALSNAMDGVPVAGAVMIKYEWLPTGFTTRGQVRDVTMLGNEAIMPFKAGRIDSTGALTVRNPSRLMNYIALQDVTAANNVGDWGGAVSFTGSTVSLTRVTLRHNQATRSGGAIAGRISHINATMLTCSHNNARMQGGCADLDRSTRLYIGRSELVNNSAGLSGGTVASQGYVYVHGTKVDKMVSMAFTGAVLHLVDSSLFCASGRAMTYIGGFGCQPDADPTPASPSLAIAAVDSDEAWWINVASTTSQIAQVMLTITMVVFVIQYFITNRSPATPGSHRSSLAARWHATQGKDAAAKDTKKSS